MIVDDRELDMRLFEADQEKYMEIYDWMNERIDEARKEFMGPHFQEKPLLTKEEVEAMIVDRNFRIKKFTELGAPEAVLEHERLLLMRTENLLRRKNYIFTERDEKYRKDYEARTNLWHEHNEPVVKKILDEVKARAEKEFSEIIQSHS